MQRMLKELRDVYVNSIFNTSNIIYGRYYEFNESIPLPKEGSKLSIVAIEGDSLRILSDNDSDDEGYLIKIEELSDENLLLINQIINFDVINSSGSIILPIVYEEIVKFELHAIGEFDYSFEEYQQLDEIETDYIIETYDSFNEALVQQKNMIDNY